jgi:hypothetical protein
MTTYQVRLTLKSRNEKTGAIPVSTSTQETCPTACPMMGEGCYAEAGPLARIWRQTTEGTHGTDWAGFTAQVAALPAGQFWRHNQAGDLPGDRETLDADAVDDLVMANFGRRGFTYTHYDVLQNEENHRVVALANFDGFTVNLSANNLDHADALAAADCGPVVVVLPSDVHGRQDIRTPEGRRVVVCPATYREDVSCASCQLCQRQRKAIVGFPAHGASKAKADKASRRFTLTTSRAA